MTVLVPLVADALTSPEAERQSHARAVTLCAPNCRDVSSELVHRNGAVATGCFTDEAFQLLSPTAVLDYAMSAFESGTRSAFRIAFRFPWKSRAKFLRRFRSRTAPYTKNALNTTNIAMEIHLAATPTAGTRRAIREGQVHGRVVC